ncbi:hypothetical protein YC2023_039401 [Brassica napus]
MMRNSPNQVQQRSHTTTKVAIYPPTKTIYFVSFFEYIKGEKVRSKGSLKSKVKLINIVFRVLAASWKRLRSTCKLWNDLFKDGIFREKHFRKAPTQSRIIMLYDYRICSLDVNLNVASPAIEFKSPLGLFLKDSQQVDIDEIFHCDGLLLCSIKDDTRLIIWNPCLGGN